MDKFTMQPDDESDCQPILAWVRSWALLFMSCSAGQV